MRSNLCNLSFSMVEGHEEYFGPYLTQEIFKWIYSWMDNDDNLLRILTCTLKGDIKHFGN